MNGLSTLPFLRIIFLNTYVCPRGVCLCIYEGSCLQRSEGLKSVRSPRIGAIGAVSCTLYVLGTGLGSSTRALVLTCWTISPALGMISCRIPYKHPLFTVISFSKHSLCMDIGQSLYGSLISKTQSLCTATYCEREVSLVQRQTRCESLSVNRK